LPGVARAIGNVGVAVDVCVGVSDEVVVVVDIDVVIAAPSAVPSPTAAKCGTHHHADSK